MLVSTQLLISFTTSVNFLQDHQKKKLAMSNSISGDNYDNQIKRTKKSYKKF